MKDSVRILGKTFRLGAVAAIIVSAGCGRSNKAADVAQDSILVKDADVSGNKTDTAGAATAALVREKGAAAQPPTLTTGAPVTRSSDVAPAVPTTSAPTSRTSTPQPPKKVYPSPVLPPRESTTSTPRSSVISSPISPMPVTQPVSPPPPPVTQPTPPTPKKDSSTDSLSVSGS